MTLARHLKNITDESKISIRDIVAWISMPGSHVLKLIWKRAAKEWREEEKNIKHKHKHKDEDA
jgi:hypothetical protein